MEASIPKKEKKNKPLLNAFLFLTITTVTAAVVLVTVLEGHRVKRENELLEYEVW